MACAWSLDYFAPGEEDTVLAAITIAQPRSPARFWRPSGVRDHFPCLRSRVESGLRAPGIGQESKLHDGWTLYMVDADPQHLYLPKAHTAHRRGRDPREA